jgi:hypothetical protein
MIALLLGFLCLLPQTGGEPQGPVLMDGIAVQAGERLVTLGEYEALLKRVEESEPASSSEDAARRRVMILRELWTAALEEQAGADLGLDPAQIDRITRLNLEEERRGITIDDYNAKLKLEGKDARGEEEDRRGQAYRELWQFKALGNAVAGQRATQDRTIRPGELEDLYEENKRRLAPIRVQLRWLIVPSSGPEGADAAKARCEEALRRLQAGEDLGLLVAELGSADFRDTLGITPLVEPRNIPEPSLWAFAETAQVGDLSPIQPLTNPRTGKPDPSRGYHLAELHERDEPPIPPFEDAQTQRVLRRFFTDDRSKRVLGRARDDLRREAYSWVNPLFEGAQTGSRGPAPQ